MPNRLCRCHVELVSLVALAVLLPVSVVAAGDDSGYLTHAQLADEIRRLETDHSSACTVESIGTSREGRDIHALRLALPGDIDPDRRPALLLVANIDGDHLVGSTVAVAVAGTLLEKAAGGDESARTR